MSPETYVTEDGQTIEVTIELGQWSAWLTSEAGSPVIGFPLESVLMEVLGHDPAREDVSPGVLRLAARVRRDVPQELWPKRPLTS